MKVMVIQGPNLNMLGHREQNIYGAVSLNDIHAQLENAAKQNKVEIEFFQSNFEGEIVDKLQECLGTVDGVIINPAAYTHTSVAIRDAISAINIPVVEVHISNIYRREEFRQKSLTAPACAGQISGFGPFGYHLALIALLQIFAEIEAINRRKAQAAAEKAQS
ncbi:MAG: type II 3-dehydroquinate dehydratase [Campylobacteraceae bacterium]|jgi:3-dehydroquinate dehydratase-2|nr:type II 3-dehydroquinate dehydratase [Campylobacteraceae bacterium]